MSSWRKSRYLARGLLRQKLQRMAHRVEFQIGLDDGGQYDPDAWSRRYTAMHRWALERCGGHERFTTTSRREVVDGSAREILIYCFEVPADAEDFRQAFFDKRRG